MKTAQPLFFRKKILFIVALALSAQLGAAQPADLAILPQPKEFSLGGPAFTINDRVTIVAGSAAEDQFAAQDLAEFMLRELGVEAVVGARSEGVSIILRRTGKDKKTLGGEGYRISVSAKEFEITAPAAAGLFYGVQTAKQLF
ncbi:MAG: glycoside hydrolase family 20 zincin-like fold domain-containing protein, partial [Chitinophagaceae bacterium]|nr:glycoside hydrolase family 20 zincin-like fold domain-containing protein [Chitinophagaceae bacterium]